MGRIRTLIKMAGPDPVLNNTLDWNEQKDLNRDNTIAEISMLIDDFDRSGRTRISGIEHRP